MEKVLALLRDELMQLKTGRATPAMVEKIMVDAYNTKMPLLELATITAPEPNQLLVAPFDFSIVRDIQRALAVHRDLGLNPVIDNQVIRINIPPLTGERREELVKVLGQKLETSRIAVRQIRHEGREKIKAAFDAKEMGEDEKRKFEEDLQELTDKMNEQIESIGNSKQKELISN